MRCFFEVDVLTPLNCYIVYTIYFLWIPTGIEVVAIIYLFIFLYKCTLYNYNYYHHNNIIYPTRLYSYIMTNIMVSETFKIRYLVVIYGLFGKSVMTQEIILKYTLFFICKILCIMLFFAYELLIHKFYINNMHYFKYIQ